MPPHFPFSERKCKQLTQLTLGTYLRFSKFTLVFARCADVLEHIPLLHCWVIKKNHCGIKWYVWRHCGCSTCLWPNCLAWYISLQYAEQQPSLNINPVHCNQTPIHPRHLHRNHIHCALSFASGAFLACMSSWKSLMSVAIRWII